MMDNKLFAILIVFISIPLSQSWKYDDQENWTAEFCRTGNQQSPIDLVSTKAIKQQGENFTLTNWNQLYDASITNNGHTVQVQLENTSPVTISGGGLPGTYNLAQFHFHWGSEHAINGDRKAFESHFVTFNNKYPSDAEAKKHHDGLAVFGFLYESCLPPSKYLNPIIAKLGKIKKAFSKVHIKINPQTLLPKDTSKFFRYSGSLTTPDCNEGVIWTVFNKGCCIAKSQVEEFASIKDAEGYTLSQNFRKLQPTNGRKVYLYN